MWSSVRSQAGIGFVIGNTIVDGLGNVDDAHLGVEGDGALVDVLPVVALGRLHVDHLPMIAIYYQNPSACFLYERVCNSNNNSQIYY